MNLSAKLIIKPTTNFDSGTDFFSIRQRLQTGYYLNDAGRVIVDRVKKRYLTFMDADGKKFPETLSSEKRQRLYGQATPWFNTGRLWESIKLGRDEVQRNPSGTVKVTGMTVVADARDPETGKQYGKKVQEATNFMSVNASDMLAVNRAVVDYIMRGKKYQTKYPAM